jgi:zinc and cadmium transporter
MALALTWALALASVIVVSLVSLVGVALLGVGAARLQRLAALLVSFAVGSLLGDVFIHLLPEILGQGASRGELGSELVLAGLLFFFLLERLLNGSRRRASGAASVGMDRPPVFMINLVADGVHNFTDGVMIGASYSVSSELGMATTLAVLCHELPQELGDFAVLLRSGLAVGRALRLNLLSASAAVLGTLAALVVGGSVPAALNGVLLPVTAGGLLYIATVDLMPSLQHERGLRATTVQLGLVLGGVMMMAAVALVE